MHSPYKCQDVEPIPVKCKKRKTNPFNVFEKFLFYLIFILIPAYPIYWLGNQSLLDFTGESIFQWYRLNEIDLNISFEGLKSFYAVPPDIHKNFQLIVDEKEHSLYGLHQAIRHIQSPVIDQAKLGIDYLKLVIDDQNLPYFNLRDEFVKRYQLAKQLVIQQELFKLGLKIFKGALFREFFGHYVHNISDFLTSDLIQDIVKEVRGEEYLYGVHSVVKSEMELLDSQVDLNNTPIPALFNLLAEFKEISCSTNQFEKCL